MSLITVLTVVITAFTDANQSGMLLIAAGLFTLVAVRWRLQEQSPRWVRRLPGFSALIGAGRSKGSR